MEGRIDRNHGENGYTEAAIATLLVLTGAMLLAMFTRTEPHPPLEVELFALGPFTAASLAIGVAAYGLMVRGMRLALSIAPLVALTALVSYGPQKYVDPAFPKIWQAVIIALVAVVIIFCRAISEAARQARLGSGRSE